MYRDIVQHTTRWTVLIVAAAAASACAETEAGQMAAAGAGAVEVRTTYGAPVAMGNGSMRAYITTEGGVPSEVGVVLSEEALSGLPSHHDAGGIHVNGHTTFEAVLELPEGGVAPFRHVLVNWNPGGHEPPGIYDMEHFDFHFYTISNAERLAIDPADPLYQQKAERAPEAALVPQGYVMPEPLAFPRMGVHWVNPSSPELRGETFTRTFIYGSWDGRVIFAEPMITKAALESKESFAAPLPAPARYAEPGYYPSGYRVNWDEGARTYRIALTGLARRG